MDYYSTFFCLPRVQQQPFHDLPSTSRSSLCHNTTATKATNHDTVSPTSSTHSPAFSGSSSGHSTGSCSLNSLTLARHHPTTHELHHSPSRDAGDDPRGRGIGISTTEHHNAPTQKSPSGSLETPQDAISRHLDPKPTPPTPSPLSDLRLITTPASSCSDHRLSQSLVDSTSVNPPNPSQSPTSHRLVSRIPSRISTTRPHAAPVLASNGIPNRSPQASSIQPEKAHPKKNQCSLSSPEMIQAACDELMSQHQCLVAAVQPSDSSGVGSCGFHISGSFPHVMAARGHLLREQPFEVEKVVGVRRMDVMQGGHNLTPMMKAHLDEIASTTRAHLSIVGSGAGTQGEVDILVRGDLETVEEAKVRVLVLLDQLGGLHSEVCEIDFKLHHIIAGRKRSVIQSIQEETSTNIYFPSVLASRAAGTGGHLLLPLSKHNLIVITGEFFGVQRAREMLFQVSMHKSKCIISRDTVMLPRKLDWLLLERLPKLEQIMYDNGTFLSLPPVGTQVGVVSVYGDHRVHIERSLRALMQLATEFYTANVWLLPNTLQDSYLNGSRSNFISSQNGIVADGHRIAMQSGAEVVFKSTNCFEVYGTDQAVRDAIQRIVQLDLVIHSQVEVRFQIELACEHREFISGKKNGKLNKIMKSSNVKIRFESFNDYNFIIDLSGNSATAMMGLKLLEDELPAEISFHIPEGYHKRIIGVGGKNIQRIMKKYGVYVKFSNAEEFAGLGGYHDNHDNVVARTPAKNSTNLDLLKQSVMELVHPKDKDFLTEHMTISRQLHRTVLGEKFIFVHDIESKTNTCFYFPSSDLGSDTVGVFGPRTQVAIAKQMMMVHVGLESDFRIPATPETVALVRSDEFDERIVRSCQKRWGITVQVLTGSGEEEQLVIKFSLQQASTESLKRAQDTLEDLLVEKEVHFQVGSPPGNHHHRRSTVTSIGSLDHATSVGTFTPVTPTEPYGFSSIHHHSSEKDLKGIFESPSASSHPALCGKNHLFSSTSSSPATYLYHQNLSTGRLYNPYVGSVPSSHGQAIKLASSLGSNSSVNEWNLIPRQVNFQPFGSSSGEGSARAVGTTPAAGGGLYSELRGGLSTSNLSMYINTNNGPNNDMRKLKSSPRAQSIDLGKPSLGGSMLMMNPYGPGSVSGLSGGPAVRTVPGDGSRVGLNSFAEVGAATEITNSARAGRMGGAGGSPAALSRHGLNHSPHHSGQFHLINGFGGLNIK